MDAASYILFEEHRPSQKSGEYEPLSCLITFNLMRGYSIPLMMTMAMVSLQITPSNTLWLRSLRRKFIGSCNPVTGEDKTVFSIARSKTAVR